MTSSVKITPWSDLLIHGASGLISIDDIPNYSKIFYSNRGVISGRWTCGKQKKSRVRTGVLKGRTVYGKIEQSLFYTGKGMNSAYSTSFLVLPLPANGSLVSFCKRATKFAKSVLVSPSGSTSRRLLMALYALRVFPNMISEMAML